MFKIFQILIVTHSCEPSAGLSRYDNDNCERGILYVCAITLLWLPISRLCFREFNIRGELSDSAPNSQIAHLFATIFANFVVAGFRI
jgi:hypothetical protein